MNFPLYSGECYSFELLTATKCSENTTDLLLHFVAAVAKVWYSASN